MGLLFVGALILAFLPNKRYAYHQIKSKDLLYKTNLNLRYYSTDDIAKAIISKDPSILLIDVRTPKEYADFTLPGAINVPYDSITNTKNLSYFKQDVYNVVMFSNGSSLADEVWLMLSRMGFENNFVMKGGLNQWIETIIRPPRPTNLAGQKEWEQYEFRKSASAYFGGAGGQVNSNPTAPTPTPVVVPQKKTGSIGGCE